MCVILFICFLIFYLFIFSIYNLISNMHIAYCVLDSDWNNKTMFNSISIIMIDRYMSFAYCVMTCQLMGYIVVALLKNVTSRLWFNIPKVNILHAICIIFLSWSTWFSTCHVYSMWSHVKVLCITQYLSPLVI